MVKESSDERLMVGAVEVDITPPIGVPLAGYGARKQNSAGIHDPLKAQALYLELAASKLLIFICDLIGIDKNFTFQLRRDIQMDLNIPPENILVACTHTHSGPQGFLPDEPVHVSLKDEGLVEITRRKLLGAAQWAVAKKEPANLSFCDLPVTGIGKNRNNPEDGPQDTQLSVLRFDNLAGDPLAVLFNYGCHPTVMGYDNLQITADLPGAARQALKNHYPGCVFIFANGASGDISTRFTRRSQSFSEVSRLGMILSGGVVQAMMKSEPVDVKAIAGESIEVQLPRRELPAVEAIESTIKQLEEEIARLKEQSAPHGKIRKVITRLEGAQGQLVMKSLNIDPSFFTTELQFLRIGPLFIAAIPGEPFSQTVLDIKSACSPKPVIVISYANDSKGYFPDRQSVEDGTYEALISPYDQSVSELIYQHTINHCLKG